MKNIFQKIKENLLVIILAAQPFLDILAYVQQNRDTSGAVSAAGSLAGYIRLALTLCIPLYTLFATKRKKPFIAVMAVIGVFSMLHILNSLREGTSGIFGDIKYLLLVAHMPILLFSFLFLYDKVSLKKQITIGMISNIIVSILVFYISYALNSGNCTYPLFQMGWTGWYVIPNAQSLVLVSLLPFAVYYMIKYCKYFFPLVAVPIVYMYTLNGTKAAFWSLVATFVGVAGFCLAEFIIAKGKLFQCYKILMVSVLVVASLLCYKYSPRQIIDTAAEESRQQEQNVIENLINEDAAQKENDTDSEVESTEPDAEPGVDVESPETKPEPKPEHNKNYMYVQYINPNLIDRFGADKVLEAYGEENLNSYGLSDMRLKKVIFGRLTWEESDFVTKLVGFNQTKMYHNDDYFDLENDPQAILFYYGYIGAGLYILLLLYYVLRVIKQLIVDFKGTFNLYNFIIIITLALQIYAATYSGYLLRRPNVSFYMMVVFLLIYCRTMPLFKKSSDNDKIAEENITDLKI